MGWDSFLTATAVTTQNQNINVYVWTGAEKMAQYLRELTAPAEDLNSVPRTYVRWLQPPITLAPGDLVPPSGIHEHLHSQCVCTPHPHIHIIDSKINLNICRKLNERTMGYLTSIFVMPSESNYLKKYF